MTGTEISTDVPAAQDRPKIFTVRQIWVATFFGGPIAAGAMYAYCLWKLDRRGIAVGVIAASAVGTAVLLAIAFVLPDGTPSFLLPVVYSSIASGAHGPLFGEAALRNEQNRPSNWLAAGFGCGSLVLLSSIALVSFGAALFVLPTSMTDRLTDTVTIGPDQSISFADGASAADARAIAKTLAAQGFTALSGHVTRKRGALRLCLTVVDGTWNDRALDDEWRELARKLTHDLGEPVEFILCDDWGNHKRTIQSE